MFRTSILAAATAALMGGTALAQPASAPPSNLSQSARTAPDYDDNDRDDGPPVAARQANPQAQATADQSRDRDMFCRRDAAARTGYTTPGEAARDEQTKGTVGGTLGGAALGAIIGAGAGNAGLGAAAGAGAGLIAGTAIGSSNARQAAHDVQADYSAAYYACMHESGDPRSAAGYGRGGYGDGYYDADYPPPPPGYYGYPAPYYPYYYGPGYYYGPAVSFGFGFGGGHGWRGGHGFHGGGHHR